MGMETLMLGALAAGTTMSVVGQLQQGKEAAQQGKDLQKIANARAAIDLENAKAARRRSVEEAKITAERGATLLARQKAGFAAGGVLTTIGSPLVVAAQTERDITKDIGFVLESGRAESSAYESSAAIEIATGKMYKKQGKAAKKQSTWGAIGTGLQGYGTMAYMGYQGGYFGGGNQGTTGKLFSNTMKSGSTTRNFPASAWRK